MFRLAFSSIWIIILGSYAYQHPSSNHAGMNEPAGRRSGAGFTGVRYVNMTFGIVALHEAIRS